MIPLVPFLKWILNERFLFGFCTLLAAVAGLFSAERQWQMFQQNSYFPSRYLSWLKEKKNLHGVIGRVVFLLCLFVLDIGNNHAALLIFTGLLLLYLIVSVIRALRSRRKSVKKLVFTARIKRTYAALIGLYGLLILLQVAVLKSSGYWFLSAAVFLSVLPQAAVFLLYALLYPVERAITRRYIRDAKRILQSYNGRLKVVGITGSYGKTGTKFILSSILKEKYNVVATPQSFNTPMGVVRTIREQLRPETEIFLCEMGAKRTGDIREICDIVSPDLGIITSVGPQHLDTFHDLHNVLNTKFELYDAVCKKGGKTYACGDNESIRSRSIRDDVVLYGSEEGFPFRIGEVACSKEGQSFTLWLRGESVRLSTRLLGDHDRENIAGAAALAFDLGVSPERIRMAVARLAPVPHRLEMKRFTAGSILIDDAYNANPVGCLDACRVLARFSDMKRVIVTPGLVELGEKEYEYNYNLGLAAAGAADVIILVGKERSKPLSSAVLAAGFAKENLYVVSSFAEAMQIYTPMAGPDTVVLFENDLPDNYLK